MRPALGLYERGKGEKGWVKWRSGGGVGLFGGFLE